MRDIKIFQTRLEFLFLDAIIGRLIRDIFHYLILAEI